MMIPIDKLGRAIDVGAFIVYGHALGRSAGLRIGKVLKIESKQDWRDGQVWRIRVQGVDDDWSHNAVTLAKPGTLQFPERLLVVDPRSVPIQIRKLLGDA